MPITQNLSLLSKLRARTLCGPAWDTKAGQISNRIDLLNRVWVKLGLSKRLRRSSCSNFPIENCAADLFLRLLIICIPIAAVGSFICGVKFPADLIYRAGIYVYLSYILAVGHGCVVGDKD